MWGRESGVSKTPTRVTGESLKEVRWTWNETIISLSTNLSKPIKLCLEKERGNSRWFVSITEIKKRVTVEALSQALSERRRVWLGPLHAGSEHPKPPENFDIIKLALDPSADSPPIAYHIACFEEDNRWSRWKQRSLHPASCVPVQAGAPRSSYRESASHLLLSVDSLSESLRPAGWRSWIPADSLRTWHPVGIWEASCPSTCKIDLLFSSICFPLTTAKAISVSAYSPRRSVGSSRGKGAGSGPARTDSLVSSYPGFPSYPYMARDLKKPAI